MDATTPSATSTKSRGQLKRLKKKNKAANPRPSAPTPPAVENKTEELPPPPDLGYDEKHYAHEDVAPDPQADAFADIFAKFQLPTEELVRSAFPLPAPALTDDVLTGGRIQECHLRQGRDHLLRRRYAFRRRR